MVKKHGNGLIECSQSNGGTVYLHIDSIQAVIEEQSISRNQDRPKMTSIILSNGVNFKVRQYVEDVVDEIWGEVNE